MLKGILNPFHYISHDKVSTALCPDKLVVKFTIFLMVQGNDLRGRMGHHKNQTHPWIKDSGEAFCWLVVIIILIKFLLVVFLCDNDSH